MAIDHAHSNVEIEVDIEPNLIAMSGEASKYIARAVRVKDKPKAVYY